MWGPHDAGPTPSGKLVFDPSRISCPQWFHRVAPRLWMHGTWHLACSAWRKSAAPESDISSVGTFAELAYIIANLAALTGAKPPKRHIPFSAAIALATAVENLVSNDRDHQSDVRRSDSLDECAPARNLC